ncbi:hypothetical protein ACFOSV_00600 [Algoriphagus namhaensis]|uniref:UbiA prenyltransferase family protein n=1 Tax=Algoriphagus namhaensis TaxID=915353 RepID=A0ABV8APH6_9BACT
MREIYIKSFVASFYKAFLGFFVLVLLIVGVFMEYKQHVLVAERLLQSDFGYITILLALLTYSFFQIRFQLTLLNEPKYRVFQNLAFLSKKDFFIFYFTQWVSNNLLIWIYGLFLTFISFGLGASYKVLVLWSTLLLIFAIGLILIYQKVQKPIPERVIRVSKLFPIVPYPFWFLTHLKTDRPLLLLGIKALSILLLNAFLFSFSSGSYDLRWVQFGLLCSAYIHIPIWMDKVEFDQDRLAFFRNYPRPISSKLRDHLINAGVLLFPEVLILLMKFGWGGLSLDLIILCGFWLALNLALYGLIQWKRWQMGWERMALIAFFGIFLLTIYGAPAIIILVFLSFFFLARIRSTQCL